MGLFGNLGQALQPDRLAMAQALMQGDYGAVASIVGQQQRLRAQQEQARAEAELDAQLRAQAASALEAEGLPKSAIAGFRPEDISRFLLENYQARQFGPEGGSVGRYDPATRGTRYERAPARQQIGRSIIDFAPNSSTPQTIYEGVEPVSVQPGGSVYGMTGQGRIVGPEGIGAPMGQSQPLQPVPGSSPAAGGPAPGTVLNGYRFRGGNPNDRTNWEPVGNGGPTRAGSGTFPRVPFQFPPWRPDEW